MTLRFRSSALVLVTILVGSSGSAVALKPDVKTTSTASKGNQGRLSLKTITGLPRRLVRAVGRFHANRVATAQQLKVTEAIGKGEHPIEVAYGGPGPRGNYQLFVRRPYNFEQSREAVGWTTIELLPDVWTSLGQVHEKRGIDVPAREPTGIEVMMENPTTFLTRRTYDLADQKRFGIEQIRTTPLPDGQLRISGFMRSTLLGDGMETFKLTVPGDAKTAELQVPHREKVTLLLDKQVVTHLQTWQRTILATDGRSTTIGQWGTAPP